MDKTDEYRAEYKRAFDSVTAAFAAGYHEPYANEHSHGDLWTGYCHGFYDAVRFYQECPEMAVA